MNYLFTSESVGAGHPDKICDQISDGILDAILAKDPMARVACETSVTTGLVLIFGEISTEAWVDVRGVAREVIRSVGYNKPEYGFDASAVAIMMSVDEQSPDIKAGVDKALEVRSNSSDDIGAGDQGMMFGYATNETPELMPLPVSLSHRLCRRIAEERRSNLKYLRPDNKSQVTIEYDSNDRPLSVHTVVISSQHDPDIDPQQMKSDILERVIKPTLGKWWNDDVRVLVNPAGNFVIGGPVGDAGLTGRKIIVDTYGGMARHGGGAFSGKDPTKVDRSGAYAARYVAKNIVAAGLAERVEVQVAYAIGVARPISTMVQSFGTGKISDAALGELVNSVVDLRPAQIINKLDLRRPIYRQTATYGHFGRDDLDLPWERTDLVEALLEEARKTHGGVSSEAN